jgi:integrase
VSVARTPDGRWLVRWRENGRNRGRRFQLKRDAVAFDDEVRRRKQLGPLAVQQLTTRGPTLGEWIAGRWAPEHGATLDQRTRDRYASSYELHAQAWLDDVPIRELDVARLRQWQGERLEAGVSADAIRKTRTFLSSVLRHAAESGAIPANPLGIVRAPRAEKRPPVRPLAVETIERIRRTLLAPMPVPVPASRRRRAYDQPDQRPPVVRLRDATLVSVLAYSGLRPSEALALRWEDVGEATLLVVDGKTGGRTVRLVAALAADLREWRMAAGRPARRLYVFPREDGERWTVDDRGNWRGRTWRSACRRAGLDPVPRPYDLRHSFASLLLAEGRTVHYVAEQLGHGAELTLRTYGHVIDEYRDKPRIDLDGEIAAARGAVGTREVHRVG